MQAFEVEGSSGAAVQNAAQERCEDLGGAPGPHPSHPAVPAECCESSFSQLQNRQCDCVTVLKCWWCWLLRHVITCVPAVPLITMLTGACLFLMAGITFCDSDCCACRGMELRDFCR